MDRRRGARHGAARFGKSRDGRARPVVLFAQDRARLGDRALRIDARRCRAPGPHQKPAALEIAKILQKWDKTRIDGLNSEGAWISDYAGYVTRTFHDPDRLRKAAKPSAIFYAGYTSADQAVQEANRAAWVAHTLPLLDLKRTFGTTQDADNKLAQMYGGLVTGDHLQMATFQDGPIIPNVAGKVSATRELHFKDAESWLAYNERFGRFSPTDGWLYNMRTAANHYGLMKVFGSRPKENFGELMAYAKNKTMGTAARIDLDTWEAALANRYAVVSGEADRPIPNMWSGIVNGVMAVQRTAKLGLTPFAMLQDNVTVSRELGRQGMGFLDRNGSILSGYFQGAREARSARWRSSCTPAFSAGCAASRRASTSTTRAPARWRRWRTRSSRSPASRR
jgi:hypothetical protein